jgi:DNA helicase-2/ATP-dependent DNA helicase PcrA
MICLCRDLLERDVNLCRYWQNSFSHILVDEFQDISPLQYQILKKLALPENHLFVVGDDDQSIYGFRGAGPDVMKQFLTDYPQAVQVVLEQNYRSTNSIVQSSLLVIRENQKRFEKQIQTQNPVGEKVILHAFDTKEEEEHYLIEKIQQLSAAQLTETAIICRTNIQLAQWSRLLTAKRIPFCCKDRVENLFEHFIAEDLLAYLNFAWDVQKDGKGKRYDFLRIMNKPSRYIRRDALLQDTVKEQELIRYYADKPYMQMLIQRFFIDLHHIAIMRPYLAIDYIRKAMGYDIWLRENVTGSEQAYRIEKADEIHKTSIAYRTLEEWKAYIEEYGEMLKEKGKNKEERGIYLLTMHGSKGLEYDTVFLPGVTAKNIPNRKAQLENQIEEERRIFYVAMTRAKQRLEISYDKEPSSFLAKLAKSPYIELKDGS